MSRLTTTMTTRLTTAMMWLMGRGDEASCAEVARHLQSYLDGHTDATQVRRIEKHLEHCRRCGLEARTYREIKGALSRRGAPVDPAAAARLTAFGQSLLAAGGDRPDDEGPA
ncbi:anti-sigma factor [Kineosporia sp. R_H_3]|uniref:anti-sigma factor family protein n=1 Tax=Kineosporia sp. R_H_3 TaxID=1961848 RepID=UPI0018E9C844|nr:zf-HC2 domain-containing protein [Kineosporia sp. R_H_3]